jgi:CheY-like chemotaxis protein
MLLQPVVKEANRFLRSTLPSTVEIGTCVPEQLPSILGNPTQIHQILMNLGSNAAHALHQQTGRLEVRLELFPVDAAFAQSHPRLRPGDYLRLTVSDTGRGMDEAVLKRIFEPFFTTKGPGEGTGLGLSVVHGIVQDHDGAIDVYSQPGQGTVFHLYFPALEETEAATVLGQQGTPSGQGERILYVDDEPALCRIADRLLKRLNYQPTTCADARRALELYLAQPDAFDLIITDLTMPHLTGIDLAAAILEKRPDAHILLATGFSGTWTRESVRSLGLRDLVSKPYNLALLGRAIHGVLHSN